MDTQNILSINQTYVWLLEVTRVWVVVVMFVGLVWGGFWVVVVVAFCGGGFVFFCSFVVVVGFLSVLGWVGCILFFGGVGGVGYVE